MDGEDRLRGMLGADELDQPAAGGEPSAAGGRRGVPYNPAAFARNRIIDTWDKYDGALSWGKGQCLAILDDGCDLSVPEWQARLPWGPKVIAAYNSIDGNDDPTPVPPGYHGTSVGYPSSLHYNGLLGAAYNNHVAHVRCASIVHLRRDESASIAEGLQWVVDHRERYGITAVNLSVLDDLMHETPIATMIDAKLEELRRLGVWVSAPCGNNGYTAGISWPACQPACFAIGAVHPDTGEVHLDRGAGTDLLVAATATSSSNAYAAACAMILREAVAVSGFRWEAWGATLPDALMAIFRHTGTAVDDPASGRSFLCLDLLAAVDFLFAAPMRTK
ncbi:S8/S53 family peptidase [Paenibacillus cymbidii]|uniref:hypothetical protein n=1 Tax=Paenibacillus cymbidii TaxID=1639034 RepID=UPI001080147D|nr:hypothetical protein [Paenibacillus cymbidii]